jgi:hypothetical protein
MLFLNVESALARLEMRELFYSFVPVLLAFLHFKPTRARFSARKSFVQGYPSVHVGWAGVGCTAPLTQS